MLYYTVQYTYLYLSALRACFKSHRLILRSRRSLRLEGCFQCSLKPPSSFETRLSALLRMETFARGSLEGFGGGIGALKGRKAALQGQTDGRLARAVSPLAW